MNAMGFNALFDWFVDGLLKRWIVVNCNGCVGESEAGDYHGDVEIPW